MKKKIKFFQKKKPSLSTSTVSSILPLNIDYFKYTDGIYSSYWVGRFINMFIIKGKKKTAARHMYQAFAQLKYSLREMPLLVLLEILEKLKPTFRLRKYIRKRNIIKEYPFVAKQSRRYIMVIQWLKHELNSEYKSASSTEIFSNRIYNKLYAFRMNPRKHSLTKTKLKHERYSVDSQFNIRYNWR